MKNKIRKNKSQLNHACFSHSTTQNDQYESVLPENKYIFLR